MALLLVLEVVVLCGGLVGEEEGFGKGDGVDTWGCLGHHRTSETWSDTLVQFHTRLEILLDKSVVIKMGDIHTLHGRVPLPIAIPEHDSTHT